LVAAVLFKLSALARERELVAELFDTRGIDADVYLPMARAQGYDAMAARALEAGFNIAQINNCGERVPPRPQQIRPGAGSTYGSTLPSPPA